MVSHFITEARHYWPALRAIVTALAAFVTLRFGRGGFTQKRLGVEVVCTPVVDDDSHRLWRPKLYRQSICTEVDDPIGASDEPPIYFFEGVPRKKALQNWEETRKWRKDNNMGKILHRPPPNHDLIRALFPTSLYQQDRAGNHVMVEKWGEVQVDQIRKLGLPTAEMLNTYMYDTEWLWRIAIPDPRDKITLIMDLKDISFETITAWDAMRLIKKRIEIGCSHYPNRAAHLLVINVPHFFAGVYRFAEPLLSSQTKSKISILTQEDVVRGAITKIIDRQNLLPEYGGTCKVPFGGSALDLKLKRFVHKPLKT
jgi:CRAL/TRIO domain